MPDHTEFPDRHAMADRLDVGADALKAIADPTRSTILTLLDERAASITQLARALDRPKGSIGHHVKVLEDAGLIHVVDTRKVRAMTEKFYARTARWFMLSGFEEAGFAPDFAVQQALSRTRRAGGADDPGFATARYARIPAERARRFGEELVDLIDRFLAEDPEGDTIFAMIAGVFPTDLPTLEVPDE